MPKPEHDDSGFFENFMEDENEDGMGKQDKPPLLTPSLLGHDAPEARGMKRATSISSMRSQISRGSSQFWEMVDSPDEDALRAIGFQEDNDDILEEPRRNWRLEVSPGPINVDSSSSPGNVTMEVRIAHPTNSNQAYSLGKRPSSAFSSPIIERIPQRRKILTDLHWESTAESLKVIAHSDLHQQYFDKHNVSWGVQWEIARLVSCGKIQYDEIPIDTVLRTLAGHSAIAAPLVEQTLCPRKGNTQHRRLYEEAFAKELSTQTLWAELDKEQEAHGLSGLGCNNDHDDWYGGKISFIVKLHQKDVEKKGGVPKYFLTLDSPELSASTRFMRRWGSHRFLRVRIPSSITYQRDNQLVSFFKNDFVIHGRVFRPFYAKDHSVFLFELDCIYTNGELKPDSRNGKISFLQFLEWHNPMEFNKDQSLAKWCARMALGLSNSVPGVELAEENIHEIDDIYSPAGKEAILSGRKPEAKHILTDGSSFANRKLLAHAKNKYGRETVPSAIQYRLGGTKGILIEHPDDDEILDESFRVWIRPSQAKIRYSRDAPPDRAHLIIDVLRCSSLKHPARLSTEIIVNLAQNGVSHDVFERLMIDGLENIAASLTQWSGPYAMQNLWAAVAAVNGSVIRSRMSREAAGSSRVLGFGSRDRDEEEVEEDEDGVEGIRSTRSRAWWADEISGCPSSLEETVMVLLDAGFEPQSCAVLAMKLREVFKKALNSYIEKYKIVVPRSAEAWIVPDPCNVLEPGEIFFKTSENLEGPDDISRDHILGDVLVTRHPCCVPSDIQKVRAVWKHELRKYRDIIIFSVKGERSLASMLGGGDYDGDTAHVIWEPSIVAAFRPPDDKFADPPPGLDDAFQKDTMTVKDYLNQQGRQPNTSRRAADLQDYLLAALKDVSLVGQYSNWHDTAVYKYGYEADEAWRLAYMFCAVLDSSKTGTTVRPEVLRKDRLSYQGRPPAWKESFLDESSSDPPPQGQAPRRMGKVSHLKFIMDHLKEAAKDQYHQHMVEFEKLIMRSRQDHKVLNNIRGEGLYVDPALQAPWLSAVERAQLLFDKDGHGRMVGELKLIQEHVQAVRNKHREILRKDNKARGRGGRQPMSPRKNSLPFTDKPIEQRQDILRELSFAFSQMPEGFEFIALSPEEIKRCRASYAYILDMEEEKRYRHGDKSWQCSRFPFDVAMRDLGIIKAESLGSCKMVTSRFYSVFSVVGAIKAFRPADAPAYTYSP